MTHSFMNPILSFITSGEIPEPCRSAIRAPHAGSMFLDDSMIPLVLTPTWETCTKEWGAGPEMRFVLTGLDGGGDDDVLIFSFFIELVRKGRKTARMWEGYTSVVPSLGTRVTVKERGRTMSSRSVDDLFEKDGRFAIVVKTETKHSSLEEKHNRR